MRWQDDAILLGFQPLGENKKIVTVLSQYHGNHKGVWRPLKRTRSLQPASLVSAQWYSRLEDQMGTWTFEPIFTPLALVGGRPIMLMALQSALSLCYSVLPEREPQENVYNTLKTFICYLTLKDYCLYEWSLLHATSFPLDLRFCTVTGKTTDLVYVSPRTGRAVSEEGAGKYKDKLLPLPAFFLNPENSLPKIQEILAALRLTGYFLERYSFNNRHQPIPLVRQGLYEKLSTVGEDTSP